MSMSSGNPTTSLHDITNTSRLSFGDQSAVDLVKSRQRKVMRDIAHFKSSVQELEREIARVSDVLLPTVAKDTASTTDSLQTMQNGLVQLNGSLLEATSRTDDFIKNSALEANNMQLEFSVRVRLLENELEEKLFALKSKRVAELRIVESIQPSDEIQEEMRELSKQLVAVTKRQTELSNENKKIVEQYELDEVIPEYNEFINRKQSTLDDLMVMQSQLLEKHVSLNEEFQNTSTTRDQLQSQLAAFEEKINNCTDGISQIERKRDAQTCRLTEVTANYDIVHSSTQRIIDEHNSILAIDKEQSGKLQREQRLRAKLSFSIHYINHTIPIVAFTPTSNVTDTSGMHPCHSVTPGLIHFRKHPLIRSMMGLVQFEILPMCELYTEKQVHSLNIIYISSDTTQTTSFKTSLLEILSPSATITDSQSFKVETLPLDITIHAVDSLSAVENMETSLSKHDNPAADTQVDYHNLLTSQYSIIVCNHERNCQGIHRLTKLARTLAVKTPRLALD